MLSATIDKTYQFAQWIENIKNKEVWIASTNKRVIPLIHYNYFVINNHIFKKTKDKNMEIIMNKINNNLLELKKNNNFDNNNILTLKKINYFMNINKLYVNNKYVLNIVTEKLYSLKMLPAICFVFSRKKCEYYANQIEKNLFEEDENIMNIIEKECRCILTKLPNYKEYFKLVEFSNIVNLLKKGIAYHHSGVMPVLREMIELLFSKGYIKLLFATETFSVGINMPTKTVLFTSLKKFDGNGERYLLPHEYTQMAGRAGRRGLDDIGHVIHLNNMFQIPELLDYQNILNGKPQTMTSKFHIYPNLILKSIANETNISNIECFANNSFHNINIKNVYKLICDNLQNEKNKLHNYYLINISLNTSLINKYEQLKEKIKICKPKKKKTIKTQMNDIKQEYKNFDNDYKIYLDIKNVNDKIERLENEKEFYEKYYIHKINNYIEFLGKFNFINSDNKLTFKGLIASQIQEVNGILFADLIYENKLDNLDEIQITCLFSWFTNIKENNDNISINKYFDDELKYIYNYTKNKLIEYYNEELRLDNNNINDDQYSLSNQINDIIYEWCYCEKEEDCINIIQQLYEKEIFLGEFVKSILKINNIAQEIFNVCELIGNIKLKNIVSKIPDLTLKFVATNQSLYI